MKLGDKTVTGLKLGTANISRAYLGSTLVWEADGGGGGGCDQVGVTAASGWATVQLAVQAGWRFRVGANPITACRLRMFLPAGATPKPHTMRLWDAGTQTLLASAEVTPVAGEWRDVAITPVELEATGEYVVTHMATDTSIRDVGRAPTSVTINAAVTTLGGRFSTLTGFPGSTTSNHYYSADVMFTL
jgi:hypothetical protein